MRKKIMTLNKPKEKELSFDQRVGTFKENGFANFKEYDLANISRGLRGYFFERNRRATLYPKPNHSRVIIVNLEK